jgi:hypothetical protein
MQTYLRTAILFAACDSCRARARGRLVFRKANLHSPVSNPPSRGFVFPAGEKMTVILCLWRGGDTRRGSAFHTKGGFKTSRLGDWGTLPEWKTLVYVAFSDNLTTRTAAGRLRGGQQCNRDHGAPNLDIVGSKPARSPA